MVSVRPARQALLINYKIASEMNELYLLCVSAVTLGIIHTVMGPDHYLPFIVLSKSRNWSVNKTMWLTFISGIAHVGSSVLIGITGIALGISLNKLQVIEASRGTIVAWMLIVFGLIYSLYGAFKYFHHGSHFHLPSFLKPKSIRNIEHSEDIIHEIEEKSVQKTTPWILILIFLFGPCEVLIPLLIFPAAEKNLFGVLLVSIVFGAATILTMMSIVYLGYKGFSLLNLRGSERYIHLFAGLVILFSGIGIQFLGL
jgi:sulfite exporter TauE/SafE